MSVDVWLCVARVPELVAQAQKEGLEQLGEAAQRRLAGPLSPRRQAQFIAGRWLLHALLRQRFGIAAAVLASITAEPDARPRLAGLHLAISHSDEWLACAVSTAQIGTDIQVPRPQRDRTALIEFICTPHERQRLACGDADGERQRLDTLWVLKEAWIKQPRSGPSHGLLDMARLETRRTNATQSNARVWTGSGFTLALAAPAEAVMCWHEAPLLDRLEPEHWRIDPR